MQSVVDALLEAHATAAKSAIRLAVRYVFMVLDVVYAWSSAVRPTLNRVVYTCRAETLLQPDRLEVGVVAVVVISN